jgi:hypothetical protein
MRPSEERREYRMFLISPMENPQTDRISDPRGMDPLLP